MTEHPWDEAMEQAKRVSAARRRVAMPIWPRIFWWFERKLNWWIFCHTGGHACLKVVQCTRHSFPHFCCSSCGAAFTIEETNFPPVILLRRK
jgi:hypothetical protein